jgi:ABC transporter
MLERFYDPLQGCIELDGINIKDINVSHLRNVIGYVGQEPTLFATTIRGNIKYGNPDATQEEIEKAARMANAHDFITAMIPKWGIKVANYRAVKSNGLPLLEFWWRIPRFYCSMKQRVVSQNISSILLLGILMRKEILVSHLIYSLLYCYFTSVYSA